MTTLSEKLEKIQYLYNKLIDFVHKRFTGHFTIHFHDGEPMDEEEFKRNKIKLEK